MILRNTLACVAAATLMAAPVVAQAAPREAAPVEGEQLRGGPWIPILLIFVVLAAVLALSAGGDDEPVSP